jgi:tetratricopeptide (TPR) repeat protein
VAEAAGGEQHNTIDGSVQLQGITIQARDVHGGVHVHSRPRPIPRQIPPYSRDFLSRREDMAVLGRLAAEDPAGGLPLLVVTGPAGIGKTALAARWLGSRAADFPDGQLYADLRGATPDDHAPPGEVLAAFLRALGAATVPADLPEQAAAWRSFSAGLRLAVLLDNAASAAQVRPLLPSGPGVVVVTSRRRLTALVLDGARHHRLAGLGTADGVALLARGIGEDRVAAELPAARRLVRACAGLPLAVCLAAARLALRPGQPVAALADALAPEAQGLAALDIEGETTVAKALDASYQALTAPAAHVYRALGALPVPWFDAAATAAACARPRTWAEDRLDELVEAHLLEPAGPGTYRFHDLVRTHARALADGSASAGTAGEGSWRDGSDPDGSGRDSSGGDGSGRDASGRDRSGRDGSSATAPAVPPDDPATVLRRLCEWYLRVASAAQQRLTPAQFVLPRTYLHPCDLPVPFDDDPGAVHWLDERRLHLKALAEAAAARGWYDTAWQLVDASWPMLLRVRHYDLWIDLHRTGVAAARQDGDARAERQMLNSGAIGLNAAGRGEEAAAWYEESLAAARAAGDARDEGQALLGLGAHHQDAGRPAQAAPYLEQAVAVWTGCGYPRGAALARTVLGETALATGRPDAAVRHFDRARRELLAVPDAHDAARAQAFLGRALVLTGEPAAGTAELEQALAVFTATGAVHWQARALEMLADSTPDPAWARALLEQARTRYEETSPADAARISERLADPAG